MAWPKVLFGVPKRDPGASDVYAVAARHRQRLLEGEAKAVREIQRAYRIAERGMRRRLAEVQAQVERATANGELVSRAWLERQERWAALLAAVNRESARFAGKALGTATRRQRESALAGRADSEELVRATSVRSSFRSLPKAAFEDLVGSFSDGSPLTGLFEDVASGAAKVAQEVWFDGLAAGENPRKIGRRLNERLGQALQGRGVLIARTESIRVYTTAQQRNYSANKDVVEASIIVSALDARTCPMCVAQHGQVLQHGESFHRHPGCRCTLRPKVKYFETKVETGEEWLRRQPADVAREKLGKARYELWRDGRIGLSDIYVETMHPKWGPGLRMRPIDSVLDRAGKPG
ncbi:MAG: minor capsid protein [Fimbriimonadaceae bacterium]|nr:minor capsid protein [Fimbriimonadaceae bacterium]QYK56656.1 MAG: minor capsid protein [Fimbriimonadaceae bacterium]